MAKLIDSVKALGEKITGEKINGDTLFDAVKDAGEKMTGKEIEGKELNDVIAETAKEYQGGGGAVVVDELPETGEVNTIYELHEQVEPAYNWVAEITQEMIDNNVYPIPYYQNEPYIFIFDTHEQMETVVNQYYKDDNSHRSYCYTRTDDKLYEVYFDGELGLQINECTKTANYSFIPPHSQHGNIYILKSFDGYDGDGNPVGTLYDGVTSVLLGTYGLDANTGFILTQVTDNIYSMLCSCETYPVCCKVTEVPVVTNGNLPSEFYIDGDSYPLPAILINDQFKYYLEETDNYTLWDAGEGGVYFGAKPFEQGAEPERYTGELEWEDGLPGWVDTIYNDIPYNEVLNHDVSDWFFQPEQGGEKVSYWVYANNKWVNMNDIGGPSPIIKEGSKIIFNLQSTVLNLNETTVTKFAFAPYNEITMWDRPSGGSISCGYYFDFSGWDYNKRIGIDLEVNGAQNQIIAYLSAWESGYWRFDQPVVVYEGDVSGLTDTSTILDHLPSELTFVLNKDDFVSEMGDYLNLFNTPTTVVYNNDRGEEISVKVEY